MPAQIGPRRRCPGGLNPLLGECGRGWHSRLSSLRALQLPRWPRMSPRPPEPQCLPGHQSLHNRRTDAGTREVPCLDPGRTAIPLLLPCGPHWGLGSWRWGICLIWDLDSLTLSSGKVSSGARALWEEQRVENPSLPWIGVCWLCKVSQCVYFPGVLGGHATCRDRSGHPPSHLSQPHLQPGFCHLMTLVSYPCGETLSQGLKSVT